MRGIVCRSWCNRFPLVVFFMIFVGCGAEAPPTQADATPDKRFETADSIVEYYNTLTTCDPVRARESLELFHAENPLQEQYISIARSMVPVAELDYAMYRRFDEFLDPGGDHHMLSPDEAASITTRDNARAQATYSTRDGVMHTLYLVQIGDNWRISGYTFEYDDDWTGMIANVDKFQDSMQKMGEAARQVMAKLEAGNYQNAQEVRTAWGQSIFEKLDFNADK